MDGVVYQGWSIEAETRALAEGGFGGKVRLRRRGDGTALRLLWLRGRWETEQEALHGAIEAGRHLVDTGIVQAGSD